MDLIVRLRKDLAGPGPHTVPWHLSTTAPSGCELSRRAATWPGLRFAPQLPNEQWQADFTHYPLADGTDTEIQPWLDDAYRYALRVTVRRRVSGRIVVAQFRIR